MKFHLSSFYKHSFVRYTGTEIWVYWSKCKRKEILSDNLGITAILLLSKNHDFKKFCFAKTSYILFPPFNKITKIKKK